MTPQQLRSAVPGRCGSSRTSTGDFTIRGGPMGQGTARLVTSADCSLIMTIGSAKRVVRRWACRGVGVGRVRCAEPR